MNSSSPGMRDFFATAHALNLQNVKIKTSRFQSKKHPVSREENLELFETLEQMIRHSGDFNANAVVDDSGLPFMQALLRAENPLPISWVKGWIDRAGMDSFFEGVPEDQKPINYWFEKRMLHLSNTIAGHPPYDDVPMATWLVINSPDWYPEKAAEWLEKLKAIDAKEITRFEPLIAAIEERGVSLKDPYRIPERFMTYAQLEKNITSLSESGGLDVLVSCPSGAQRTLGQFLALQGYAPARKIVDLNIAEDELIPLPHGRRDELARKWVMSDDLSIDEARARFWAVILDKPEAVGVLIADYWGSSNKKRFEEIVTSRDSHGRSLSAFLRNHEKENLLKQLTEYGLANKEDFYAENGAGIIEQCLASALGLGYKYVFSYDSARALNEVDLGPVERYSLWSDYMVDQMVFSGPTSSRRSLENLIDAMKESPEKQKMEEARCIQLFNRLVNIKPHNGYPDSKETGRLADEGRRILLDLNPKMEVLKQRPILLDIGVVDWRQWEASIGMEGLLNSKPLWMREDVYKKIVEFREIISIRVLERDLSRPQVHNQSQRKGMRL